MEGSLLAPRVHFAMVLERFVHMSVFLDNVSSKKHNSKQTQPYRGNAFTLWRKTLTFKMSRTLFAPNAREPQIFSICVSIFHSLFHCVAQQVFVRNYLAGIHKSKAILH